MAKKVFHYKCDFCANDFGREADEMLTSVVIKCPECGNFLEKDSFYKIEKILIGGIFHGRHD